MQTEYDRGKLNFELADRPTEIFQSKERKRLGGKKWTKPQGPYGTILKILINIHVFGVPEGGGKINAEILL